MMNKVSRWEKRKIGGSIGIDGGCRFRKEMEKFLLRSNCEEMINFDELRLVIRRKKEQKVKR